MRIALRSPFGYVTAERGGELQPLRGLVTANRSQVGAWETWRVVELPGGGVALQSVNGYFLCAEGGGGSVVYANRADAQSWETFTPIPAIADGQAVRLVTTNGAALAVAPDGEHEVRALGEATRFVVEVVEADAIATPPDGGFLTCHGMDFYRGENPWLFAGIATHTLLNEVVAGRDIRPLLRAWKSYGANTTIAIGLHASPWKDAHGYRLDPTQTPHYFDALASMFDIHAAEGMRCLFHILADVQYMPSSFDARAHVGRCGDVLRGRWNAFASKGNESNVNGWREDDYTFPDLGGVLRTQGSQGEDNNPHVPYLDFCLFEVTRGRKRLYDNGAGMRQLFDGDFEGPATQRPTLSIEPTAFHDVSPDDAGDVRETDARVALAMAVNISANSAGGGLTMSDAMVCRPMRPAAEHIAREWFRGLYAGFVR